MNSRLKIIFFSSVIIFCIINLIISALCTGANNTEIQEDNDSSGFSSDGPVIVYQDSKVLNYSVIPNLNETDGNLFEISVGEISKYDTLTCIVDETVNQFDFKLKDYPTRLSPVFVFPNKKSELKMSLL